MAKQFGLEERRFNAASKNRLSFSIALEVRVLSAYLEAWSKKTHFEFFKFDVVGLPFASLSSEEKHQRKKRRQRAPDEVAGEDDQVVTSKPAANAEVLCRLFNMGTDQTSVVQYLFYGKLAYTEPGLKLEGRSTLSVKDDPLANADVCVSLEKIGVAIRGMEPNTLIYLDRVKASLELEIVPFRRRQARISLIRLPYVIDFPPPRNTTDLPNEPDVQRSMLVTGYEAIAEHCRYRISGLPLKVLRDLVLKLQSTANRCLDVELRVVPGKKRLTALGNDDEVVGVLSFRPPARAESDLLLEESELLCAGEAIRVHPFLCDQEFSKDDVDHLRTLSQSELLSRSELELPERAEQVYFASFLLEKLAHFVVSVPAATYELNLPVVVNEEKKQVCGPLCVRASLDEQRNMYVTLAQQIIDE